MGNGVWETICNFSSSDGDPPPPSLQNHAVNTTHPPNKNNHHHHPPSSRQQKTQRIVHRDIKSENVFRTDCGTWKLGDFGSALKLGDARTLERQVMGGGVGVGRGVVRNRLIART